MSKKKLYNEAISPFMQETDPRNPYGPNYEELPFETKIYYKYNKVKKYVHFAKEDEDVILNANFKFMFGLLGTITGSIVSAYILKRFIFKPFIPKIFEYCSDYSQIYYGSLSAGCTTYSYFVLNDFYINDVCYPLLLKYTQKAIENGFEDYTISKYRKFNIEQEIKEN